MAYQDDTEPDEQAPATITLAEADPRHARDIREALEPGGHRVVTFGAMLALPALRRAHRSSLVIVGRRLSDVADDMLLRRLRQEFGSGVPLLALYDVNAEVQVESGPQGADDFILLPARAFELRARVRALLRRTPKDLAEVREVFRVGNYVVDTIYRSVQLGDSLVDLSAQESGLALLLFQNVGQTLSREAIELAVWGRIVARDSRRLDNLVYRLRHRLHLAPENGVRLHTLYSSGFMLVSTAPPDDSKSAGALPLPRAGEGWGEGN